MTTRLDNSTKRSSAEAVSGGIDQGESKRAAVDDSSSPDDHELLPSRDGVQVDLVVESIDKYVEILGQTTGAKEYFRCADDNQKVLHLAMNVGGVAMFLGEKGNSMEHGGTAPYVRLHLASKDPSHMAQCLVSAGAETIMPCEHQFWGVMYGQYKDPFGLTWCVGGASGKLEKMPEDLESKIVPFISVRDAATYLKFLSDAFGAETKSPPAKDPSGKIMCVEVKINNGSIMVADHVGADAGVNDAIVTISHEVPEGKAQSVVDAIEECGGHVIDPPAMQFWGQVWGRCKDFVGLPWGICEPPVKSAPSKQEMDIAMKLGAKYDWKYTWVVEDVPRKFCYGEVVVCGANPAALKEAMEPAFAKSITESAKAGISPVGPAAAIYFKWESGEGGQTRFTIGPLVAAPDEEAKGEGLGVRSCLGCKCVSVGHTGPYDGLMKCYMATFEWIAAMGYDSSMPLLEVYENDPRNVEPANLRTKIIIPVTKKADAAEC